MGGLPSGAAAGLGSNPNCIENSGRRFSRISVHPSRHTAGTGKGAGNRWTQPYPWPNWRSPGVSRRGENTGAALPRGIDRQGLSLLNKSLNPFRHLRRR